MNLVNCICSYFRTSLPWTALCILVLLPLSLHLQGCSDGVRPPSAGELAEFKNAGHMPPRVDVDRLVDARIGGGPHRVVAGEVIELTMPTVLQIVTAEEPESSGTMAPYISRVSPSGTITLPVVGEIGVEGKTLAEIEAAVIDAYHPEYTVTRPSVFARILEYKTADVSISGAVKKPGIYSLRSDQMSLVSLLMEAEGIVDEGAALIQIKRSSGAERNSKKAGADTIEVQLSFRPIYNSGTKGRLTVTSGQEVLLAQQLDICSETGRQIFLERLIRREPRLSTRVLNERLCVLAELLSSASGTRFAGDHLQNDSAAGKLTDTRQWAAKSSDNFKQYGKGMLPRGGYDLRENGLQPANAEFGLYDKFSTDDVKPTLAIDSGFSKAGLRENGIETAQFVSTETTEPESMVLPIKGLNIPFADVALQDGDRVIVERLREPMITVVGLVNKAGNFPYPPDVEYNLMHALGFAGGVNMSAEPRYATIYRLAADGTTASATFNIAGIAKSEDPTDALSVVLKPYDVVAVEHTPRTRAKVFWDRVFRFYISTHLTSDDIFGDD